MNKKRVISVLLSLILFFTMVLSIPLTSHALTTGDSMDDIDDDYYDDDDEYDDEDEYKSYNYYVGTDEFEYEVYNDGTVVLYSYSGDSTNLVIPSVMDGHKIDTISDNFFEYLPDEVVALTIPDGIKKVECNYISSFSGLTYITLGKDLKEFGDGELFTTAKNLISIDVSEENPYFKSVDGILYSKDMETLYAYPRAIDDETFQIPEGVKTIGNSAFYSANFNKVIIPSSVTRIGSSAFEESEISEIIIPDSVTVIESSSFSDCENLESVKLGENLKEIWNKAFDNCPNLKKVTLYDELSEIGEYAFGYYYESSTWERTKINGFEIVGYNGSLAADYANNNGFKFTAIDDDSTSTETESTPISDFEYSEVEYPDEYSGIAITGYKGNSDEVIIPRKINHKIVLAIGERAFEENETIKKVVFPSGLKRVGEDAFSNCESLQTVVFPSGLERIGEDAFYFCTNLQTADLPDSLWTIEESAFWGCKSLKKIVIPDSVSSCGYSSFRECSAAESIYIGKGLSEITGDMFLECTAVKSIIVNEENQSLWSDGCNAVFDGTDYSFYGKSLVVGCNTSTIPYGIETIGNGAFIGMKGIKNINIPNSVTAILSEAFLGCDKMKSVIIPSSVQNIGEYALGYTYTDDIYEKTKITGFTIYGDIGSVAEKYAKDNGFTFKDKSLYVESTEPVETNPVQTTTDPAETTIPESEPSTETEETTSTNPMFELDKVKGEEGGTVEMKLSIKNNPGITALSVEVDYDSTYLELLEINDGGLFNSSISTSKQNIKPAVISWFDPNSEDCYSNGTLAILKFRVLDGAEDSNVVLKYDSDNVLNSELNNQEFEIVNGKVTVDKVYVTPTKPEFNPTMPTKASTSDSGYSNNPGSTPIKPSIKAKKANPIKVTVKTKTVKLKKLKKKAQKVKAITVKKARGKVSYKLVKRGIKKKIRKFIKISKKGVITIKKWKKAKKGTYKIKVIIKAAGNSSYKAKSITKKVKVRIK